MNEEILLNLDVEVVNDIKFHVGDIEYTGKWDIFKYKKWLE